MFPGHPLSLTLRVSIVFALIAAVTISALGHWLYRFLDREIERQERLYLGNRADLVKRSIAEPGLAERMILPERVADDLVLGDRRLQVTIYDEKGKPVLVLNGEPVPLSVAPPAAKLGQEPTEFGTWISPEGQRRLQTVAVQARTASGRTLLAVVASDMSVYQALTDSYHRAVLSSTVLASLFAAGLGFAVSRRVLSPIRKIAAIADQMSTHHLNQRLYLEDIPNEVKQLAGAFNRMLDRLDEAFSRVSQFSSDLAHELRTPISNVIVQTQVTLSRSRSADEYRTILESNAEEYERLSQMIEQMLFLAYTDSVNAEIAREEFDGREEIERLKEFFLPMAEERKIRIDCTGDRAVYADRVLYRRALSNLISNALRHAPEGGTVVVTIDRRATGETDVKVTNPGHGIPAEHLPRLFDRFYRAETARENSSGGSGLGLAIVKSIMDLHHGIASVQSVPDSVTFTLTFPAPPKDEGKS